MYRGEIFLSAGFGTKFQREVALFLELPEFLYNADITRRLT